MHVSFAHPLPWGREGSPAAGWKKAKHKLQTATRGESVGAHPPSRPTARGTAWRAAGLADPRRRGRGSAASAARRTGEGAAGASDCSAAVGLSGGSTHPPLGMNHFLRHEKALQCLRMFGVAEFSLPEKKRKSQHFGKSKPTPGSKQTPKMIFWHRWSIIHPTKTCENF